MKKINKIPEPTKEISQPTKEQILSWHRDIKSLDYNVRYLAATKKFEAFGHQGVTPGDIKKYYCFVCRRSFRITQIPEICEKFDENAYHEKMKIRQKRIRHIAKIKNNWWNSLSQEERDTEISLMQLMD
jgi:hypothetical protein